MRISNGLRINKISVIKIFELSGIATIILSLVFIVYEIRQANTIAMIQAKLEIQGNFSAINELIIGNKAFADLLYKMTDENAKLEGGELEQVRAHVRRMANVWGAAETSDKAGLLTEKTYNIVFDDMRNLFITYPASRDSWREILELYPMLQSGFFSYSRELLKELENAEK